MLMENAFARNILNTTKEKKNAIQNIVLIKKRNAPNAYQDSNYLLMALVDFNFVKFNLLSHNV